MTVVMTVAVLIVLTKGAVVGVADFVAAIGEQLSNLFAVQCRVDPSTSAATPAAPGQALEVPLNSSV